MYPLLRFAYQMVKFRNAPPLGVLDAHISTHHCWPWDIDPWIELNNGRTLTLYDLGRLPMAHRTGLVHLLRQQKWGITVAGNSTRYRRRIRAFDQFTMVSRTVGWDQRFFYIDQSMWRKGDCCNQMLVRMAITDDAGIVSTERVLAAWGRPMASPELPEWISGWIAGDARRPWPPALPHDAEIAVAAS